METMTVAGLVRQFPEGEEAFVSVDGFSVLMRAMQSDEEKLQVKAAFLLANIMLSDPKHKGSSPWFLCRICTTVVLICLTLLMLLVFSNKTIWVNLKHLFSKHFKLCFGRFLYKTTAVVLVC